jgi:hypothetical protein
MKMKTGYRPKKPEVEIPLPNNPAVAPDIPPQPEAKFDTPAVEEKAEPPIAPEPPKDEAAEALKKALAAEQRAAEYQRQMQQCAAQMAQPPAREQLLEQWRQQGMSETNLRFLVDNPELIDGWQLTVHAAQAATQQGHELDSDAHRQATRQIFHQYLEQIQAHAQAQAQPNGNGATPAPLTEPQPMPPNEQPRRQQQPAPRPSLYSAPPSRDVPGSGYRSDFADDPKSVRLTPDHLEAARIAGVTPEVYAKNLLKMERMKRDGSFNNQ